MNHLTQPDLIFLRALELYTGKATPHYRYLPLHILFHIRLRNRHLSSLHRRLAMQPCRLVMAHLSLAMAVAMPMRGSTEGLS